MDTLLIGCILGGTIMLSVFLYVVQLILLATMIPRIKTESAGIKNLKFQDHNAAWNKYVLRKKYD